MFRRMRQFVSFQNPRQVRNCLHRELCRTLRQDDPTSRIAICRTPSYAAKDGRRCCGWNEIKETENLPTAVVQKAELHDVVIAGSSYDATNLQVSLNLMARNNSTGSMFNLQLFCTLSTRKAS